MTLIPGLMCPHGAVNMSKARSRGDWILEGRGGGSLLCPLLTSPSGAACRGWRCPLMESLTGCVIWCKLVQRTAKWVHQLCYGGGCRRQHSGATLLPRARENWHVPELIFVFLTATCAETTRAMSRHSSSLPPLWTLSLFLSTHLFPLLPITQSLLFAGVQGRCLVLLWSILFPSKVSKSVGPC